MFKFEYEQRQEKAQFRKGMNVVCEYYPTLKCKVSKVYRELSGTLRYFIEGPDGESLGSYRLKNLSRLG